MFGVSIKGYDLVFDFDFISDAKYFIVCFGLYTRKINLN